MTYGEKWNHFPICRYYLREGKTDQRRRNGSFQCFVILYCYTKCIFNAPCKNQHLALILLLYYFICLFKYLFCFVLLYGNDLGKRKSMCMYWHTSWQRNGDHGIHSSQLITQVYSDQHLELAAHLAKPYTFVIKTGNGVERKCACSCSHWKKKAKNKHKQNALQVIHFVTTGVSFLSNLQGKRDNNGACVTRFQYHRFHMTCIQVQKPVPSTFRLVLVSCSCFLNQLFTYSTTNHILCH